MGTMVACLVSLLTLVLSGVSSLPLASAPGGSDSSLTTTTGPSLAHRASRPKSKGSAATELVVTRQLRLVMLNWYCAEGSAHLDDAYHTHTTWPSTWPQPLDL